MVLTTTFPRWEDDQTPGFVYDLSKRLRGEGFEIVILAPHHYGAKINEEMDHMMVYRFPYFYPTRYQKLCYEGGILPNIKRSYLAKIQVPFLIVAELYNIIKLIKQQKIDIIHSHWIVPSGLLGCIVSKITGLPHITTAHAGDVFTIEHSNYLKVIGKFILKNSDKITVNSTFTKNSALNIYRNLNSSKIEIIPMGVDTSIFCPKNKTEITHKSEYIIFSVGRLVEKKGIEYLIKAIPFVLNKLHNVRLVIGGSGPLENDLKKLVVNLNLSTSVIFTGYIKNLDLPKYYASSDVFVLPSIKTAGGDTEGLGVVLLEAMACGLPVIGSNLGGITDIIENGKNGFLVEDKNPEDIADKIIKLLSNERLRQRFSEEGLKIVNEVFSWDVVTEKFKINIMRLLI